MALARLPFLLSASTCRVSHHLSAGTSSIHLPQQLSPSHLPSRPLLRRLHAQAAPQAASKNNLREDGPLREEKPSRELFGHRMTRGFGVMIVTGSLAFAVYTHLKAKSDEKVVKAVQSVGAPKIGGPFTLANTKGEYVTEEDFPGYRLMYFGFTFCPDICPTELTKMGDALRLLEARGARLKNSVYPIFVSVDPWRDSIAQVRAYVAEFHPLMEGLTGTPLEIEKMCRRYRIYYSKPPKKVRDGIVEDEFYLMDHSAYMYLMSPTGECIDYFNQAEPAEEIARRLEAHIGKEEWWSLILGSKKQESKGEK